MSTHSVIIGKSKEGYYVFGQCMFDGDLNYKWLSENLTDPDKVEEFLQKLKNVGVRSMWYKRNPKTHTIDKSKPYIDWMDESYNCGISKTKKAVFEENGFDWPEYCTYWDGKKWKKM